MSGRPPFVFKFLLQSDKELLINYEDIQKERAAEFGLMLKAVY